MRALINWRSQNIFSSQTPDQFVSWIPNMIRTSTLWKFGAQSELFPIFQWFNMIYTLRLYTVPSHRLCGNFLAEDIDFLESLNLEIRVSFTTMIGYREKQFLRVFIHEWRFRGGKYLNDTSVHFHLIQPLPREVWLRWKLPHSSAP